MWTTVLSFVARHLLLMGRSDGIWKLEIRDLGWRLISLILGHVPYRVINHGTPLYSNLAVKMHTINVRHTTKRHAVLREYAIW